MPERKTVMKNDNLGAAWSGITSCALTCNGGVCVVGMTMSTVRFLKDDRS